MCNDPRRNGSLSLDVYVNALRRYNVALLRNLKYVMIRLIFFKYIV